ncbi:hypothetical protein [Chryseobacterium sp.]|uniref:hypothetical protein n=1 Tax=Chryseobacterium sp. TaxID=1871047 RepID=UPI0012A98DCF|nr:hypothetical protein [Chryseobacterium sp.]QFG53662.1 hypothetical protein F7R58_08885 [Chryseobacterium sp.]
MKYVIYKRNGLFLPVTFPDHITHSQVKIEWEGSLELYSAGFFSLNSFGLPVILPGISESLNIGPSSSDEDILRRFYLNCETSHFIDYSEY